MNMLLQNDLQETKELREEFKVTDLQSATWVLRKLRAVNAKVAEINNTAVEEISRINEWAEKEVKSLNDDKEYFEGLLSAYYIEERSKDKKFKLSTPYGKVTARNSKKWVYEDEESLLEYLKQSEPRCLRVKEEINKTEVKMIFKNGVNSETGEILPFVRIEEEESISIKTE